MVYRHLPACQARIVSGDTPPLSVSFADSSPRGGAKGAAAPGGVPPLAIRYGLHPSNGCPSTLDPGLRAAFL